MLDVDLTAPATRPALPPFGLLPPAPAGQKFDWAALLAECGALVAEQYDLITFLDNKRTNTQVKLLRRNHLDQCSTLCRKREPALVPQTDDDVCRSQQ